MKLKSIYLAHDHIQHMIHWTFWSVYLWSIIHIKHNARLLPEWDTCWRHWHTELYYRPKQEKNLTEEEETLMRMKMKMKAALRSEPTGPEWALERETDAINKRFKHQRQARFRRRVTPQCARGHIKDAFESNSGNVSSTCYSNAGLQVSLSSCLTTHTQNKRA